MKIMERERKTIPQRGSRKFAGPVKGLREVSENLTPLFSVYLWKWPPWHREYFLSLSGLIQGPCAPPLWSLPKPAAKTGTFLYQQGGAHRDGDDFPPIVKRSENLNLRMRKTRVGREPWQLFSVNGILCKVSIHVLFPEAFLEQDRTFIPWFPCAVIVLGK